jgi:hypothetical protein
MAKETVRFCSFMAVTAYVNLITSCYVLVYSMIPGWANLR